jgi:FlaA1/EpsC-like NDP-sugar epimerase
MKRVLYFNLFVVLGADIILVALSWCSAYALRFNFDIPGDHFGVMVSTLPFILLIKILVFYLFDLYRGMWRYTSISDLINIAKAASTSSLLIVSLVAFTHGFAGFSRASFIIDWVLTIFFIGGYRLGIRLFFWVGLGYDLSLLARAGSFGLGRKKRKGAKNLLIIGAGDAGEKILREILDNERLRYQAVGFVDDDELKVGKQIHGVPVLGTSEELKTMVESAQAEELLIAIPSATSAQMRRLLARCGESGLPYKTVPGIGELIGGKVSVTAIREVAYGDLLGREAIRLEEDRIGAYLENSGVLVTGAGGSIGSELCRQICRFRPDKLVLYERAESPLYEMGLELQADFPHIRTVLILGDITDRQQLTKAFSTYRPSVVFHAAAYKHVPMMELLPWKAIKNNVLGTRNVIDATKQHGVERFVLVSSDKAVRPVSVMGASKKLAELLVQGQNGCGLPSPKFMTVRFGNVVGSVGSVIPLFQKQIERGGPVTVTHPDVTRFFMTIPEACQLILQAGAMGEGGETFILEMGQPVKIVDMARDLIRLSGFEPDADIKIEYIGLRPGEKLHEELRTKGEGILPTSHEKILVLKGITRDQIRLNGEIDDLAKLAYEQDAAGIRKKLQEIVEDYRPNQEQTTKIG